jgi:hypothetical protein
MTVTGIHPIFRIVHRRSGLGDSRAKVQNEPNATAAPRAVVQNEANARSKSAARAGRKLRDFRILLSANSEGLVL